MLTLHQGEGTISTIKWRTDLIAWANSKVCLAEKKYWCIGHHIEYKLGQQNRDVDFSKT